MTSIPSRNIWIRRQQCPCGDWKCYVTYEGDSEEASSIASQLVKNDSMASEAMVFPYVGMVFKSDDDAFEYYGSFARKNGFAPMKKKPTGNVHNHELLEDDQVRLLPAYRKIHEADQERILLLSKAGFPIHHIVKALELEKGIQGGQLPFLERDVRNFVQNRKKVVQENDALLTEKRENDTLELLEACKGTKEADEDFVFDFTVDENDKVEHIAWSYGDLVHAYTMFGDAVYFDTSYQSITYGVLFGAWLGIDNHGRTIFFGCVLLQDETPRSISWAFQTFVRFMRGRFPQTVLTDLDPELRDAIRSELPGTKHVISIWDILPKISSWFSVSLGPRCIEFKSEFDE
ncbi:hypothetical protein FF1_037131 [Malus domestica]